MLQYCLLAHDFSFGGPKIRRQVCWKTEALLRRQCAFLGIPDSESWPGHGKLPLVRKYMPIFTQSAGTTASVQTSLRSSDCVERPLSDNDESTINLVSELLQWDPAKRLPAEVAMSRPLFPTSKSTALLACPLMDTMQDRHNDPDSTTSRPNHDTNPIPAGAPCKRTHDHVQVETTCQCSGNCGSKLCKRSQNQKVRRGTSDQICDRPQDIGHTLCVRCRCEVHGCSLPKNHVYGKMRWCSKHGKSELGRAHTMGGVLREHARLA